MARMHHKLNVWKKSIELVSEVYNATKSYPKDEAFVLVPQIRRAAISISSNIAEGAGRSGKKEYLKYLNIAHGSLSELETHLIISKKLGYLEDAFGLLGGLINSIANRK